MHRASPTFADRLPSHGLLLLRVIVATTLIGRCVQVVNGTSLHTVTSIAGASVAVIELFIAFSHGHDPWLSVLLVTIGIALALLGPGSWSVDARRSGWKRIDIRRPDN